MGDVLREVVRELVHRGNHRDLAEKLDASDPEKEETPDAEES